MLTMVPLDLERSAARAPARVACRVCFELPREEGSGGEGLAVCDHGTTDAAPGDFPEYYIDLGGGD